MFEEGMAFAEKVGDEIFLLRFLNCLGWLHLELGGLEASLELNRRCAEGAKKRGDPETWANSAINMGDVFIAKGDLVLAQELLDEVLRNVEDPAVSEWQKWRYSMHLFSSLGEVWLGRGDPSRARGFADRCLEIAARTSSRKYLAWAYRLQGEVELAWLRHDDAEQALHQALTMAQVVGNPTQLWKTHAALGRLHTDARRPDRAREAYRVARGVLDRVLAGLHDPGLRASLENSPAVRAIYQEL